MIGGLPADKLDLVWPQVWAVLQRAFAYNADEFSEDFVYNKIRNRDYQLWLEVGEHEITLAIVTSLQQYPDKLTCFIVGLAGVDSNSFAENLKVIEHWAKAKGAKDIEYYGREGLKKTTKALGFKLRYIVMAKEIED